MAARGRTHSYTVTHTPYAVRGDFVALKQPSDCPQHYIPGRLLVPAGSSVGTPLPLVIYLNGAQSTGANPDDPTLAGFWPVTGSFGQYVTTNKATFSAFAWFPQCPLGPGGTSGTSDGGLFQVAGVLGIAAWLQMLGYSIDLTRIHLVAYSAGASMAYRAAYSRPAQFATVTWLDGAVIRNSFVSEGYMDASFLTNTDAQDEVARALGAASVAMLVANSDPVVGATETSQNMKEIWDHLVALGYPVTYSMDGTFTFSASDRFVYTRFPGDSHADIESQVTASAHAANVAKILAFHAAHHL